MSDLFEPVGPNDPEPELIDPRQAVIAELRRFADEFEVGAATAHTHGVILTLRSCAKKIENRIDALRRGDPLAF